MLKVARSAPVDEIRTAYRRLARTHHPDAVRTVGDDGVRMAQLNEAWRVLSDPARRAMYDANSRPTRLASAVASEAAWDDVDDRLAADSHGRRRIPISGLLLFVVLAAIFVFTAYATGSHGGGNSIDGVLSSGSCIRLAQDAVAVEVSCSGPHDGVVEQVLPSDFSCPSTMPAVRDQRSTAKICLRPG